MRGFWWQAKECLQPCENILEELNETLFCPFFSLPVIKSIHMETSEFIWFQKMIYSLCFSPFLSSFSLWTTYHCFQWPAGSAFTKKCMFGVVGSVKHEINQCHIFHALLTQEPKLNFTLNNLSSWHAPHNRHGVLMTKGRCLCHQTVPVLPPLFDGKI